jgi:HEAT repeat protein
MEKIGKPAVPFLVELLFDPNRYVRWEVCKALGAIRDASAADALAKALDDESVEVRWLAAEALIALGSRAIVPLLHVLELRFNSIFVRQSANHVLNALKKENLLNREMLAVLDTLRSMEPRISVPVAARNALESIRRNGGLTAGYVAERSSKRVGHNVKENQR